MRRGELLAIRWMDIDLTNRRILLNTSKNGEGRFVYLPQLACKLIESLPRNKARVTDFVFPVSQEITPEAVSVAFARACKKANVHGCRFHDLRHTAATHLRLEGSDSHCVAQLAGQKSMKVAQGYQHLTPAYLSSQMSGLDHAFRELNDLPLLLNGQQAEASGHDGVTIEQQNATESVQTTVS
jgi:integrase